MVFSGEFGKKFNTRQFWLLVVLSGSILPHLAILLTGKTIVWRDSAQLYAPMRSLIVEALRNGQLPLWNPYEAMGMPLFAQSMHGVLHPWSIMSALFPQAGLDLLIVLHSATAALGAAVLARILGASRNGAIVAGLGYGLSGYVLGMSSNLVYLAGGGSAPWAIAGLYLAAHPGKKRLAFGAVGVAVLCFAGDPQWAMVSILLGVVFAWQAGGWQGVARGITAVLLGVALAGIQLIPSWEFLGETSRSAGLTEYDLNQWPFMPIRLMELILPGFFGGQVGSTTAPVFTWFDVAKTFPLPFVPSVFVGAPVLILAAAGVKAGRVPRMIAWAAILFVWLAMGHLAGADKALGWVPVWGSFRYAEKLIGPFSLCLALIAAFGLERFANSGHRSFRWSACAALSSLCLAGCALLLGKISSPLLNFPEDVWRLVCQRSAAGFLLAALGLACLSLAVSRHHQQYRFSESWRTKLVLAAVLVTGLCGAPAALHRGDRDTRPSDPLSTLRASHAVPRIFGPIQVINCPKGKDCSKNDFFYEFNALMGNPSYNVLSRVDNIDTYTGLKPSRATRLKKALNALGVNKFTAYRRFAVTHVPVPPSQTFSGEKIAAAATQGGHPVSLNRDWNILAYEVPHRPWASFATSFAVVPGEVEAVEAAVSLAAAGNTAVVLAGDHPVQLSDGIIQHIERSPSLVRVKAETPDAGLLVVADAYWRGWKAEIDGKPTDIYLADGVVRAVSWPAGQHLLEMRYDPVEVKAGAAVSGCALIVLSGIVAFSRSRRV